MCHMSPRFLVIQLIANLLRDLKSPALFPHLVGQICGWTLLQDQVFCAHMDIFYELKRILPNSEMLYRVVKHNGGQSKFKAAYRP